MIRNWRSLVLADLRLADGRFAVLGDDCLERAHGREERALELADLAAVDDEIALAREGNHLLLHLCFVEMRAGGAALRIDAGGREEGNIDAEAGEHVEVMVAGKRR